MTRPAAEANNLVPVRSDDISKPGMITAQVIRHILNDALVVYNQTLDRVRCPGPLSTPTLPPCCSVIHSAIESPSPVLVRSARRHQALDRAWFTEVAVGDISGRRAALDCRHAEARVDRLAFVDVSPNPRPGSACSLAACHTQGW